MRYKAANVVKVAFVVALMCVLAWVTIPFGPVPFTLQTLGIMIALKILSPKDSFFAVSVYLLLGTVGLPVFSSFGSGFGVLFGPTGGFLFGFLFGTLGYVFLQRLLEKSKLKNIVSLLAFLIICYVFGCGYYALAYKTGIITALTICAIPYIVPEILKLLLAFIVGKRIGRYL